MTEQASLLTDASEPTPVTCLGLTFETYAARRAYFRERLREKLADPAFRAIESGTIGVDQLRKSARLQVHRQGAGWDMVGAALRLPGPNARQTDPAEGRR